MIVALVAIAVAVIAPRAAQAAAPEFLVRTPENGVGGSAAAAMNFPSQIAASPIGEGDVYVADENNNRIDQFSAWGEFIQAWGWGVLDGNTELETCTTATGCIAGSPGSGSGQLHEPKGVAVDPSGDVYVGEGKNHRVQKFSASGDFLLMFGANVNATKVAEGGSTQAERNVCTAASGDTCQAGTSGAGPGEIEAASPSTVVDPASGVILIAEENRIQKFSAQGSFLEDIALALPSGTSLNSLAADEAGNLYATFFKQEGGSGNGLGEVRKLKATGPTVEYLTPTFATGRPTGGGLAVSPSGDVYVAVRPSFTPTEVEPATVLTFDSSGHCLTCNGDGEGGKPGFAQVADSQIVSLATGSACGPTDVYMTHFVSEGLNNRSDFVAYGDPPNPLACPPPVRPPEIQAQFGITAGSHSATVGAEINPRFWSDTTYYVEYGTAPCSLGGCQSSPLPPGSVLTSKVTQRPLRAAVDLTGLHPETIYHFRFVAQGSGGGPVRGTGGIVGVDGSEATVTTFPEVLTAPTCPNDVFRVGLAAVLPNCRAYEMVSPVNKEGGDIAPAGASFERGLLKNATLAEASADGNRATFSSKRAFGDPRAAPLFNQFLSVRTSTGWLTNSISPPRKPLALYGPSRFGQFKFFTEDLCSAWLTQDSDIQLAEGAPAGFPGVYRRNNCTNPPTYTSMGNVVPPGYIPGKTETEVGGGYIPVPQGYSGDGEATVFRAPAKLTNNACGTVGVQQLYEVSETAPLRLVSVEPNGTPTCNHSFLGTKQTLEGGDGFRESNVVHAISSNGDRVYWTNSGISTGNDAPGPGTVYVRTNSLQPQSSTTGNECTQPARACTFPVSGGGKAIFWAATPDGSSAMYTEGESLLTYNLASKTSQLVASGVTGVVGASTDLSRIYFVSTRALTGAQQNSSGDEAHPGEHNLYLAEAGGLTFVASLEREEGEGTPDAPASIAPWLRTSRVTDDGLHVAFTSARPLTHYDNTDVASGEADSELFLYHATPSAGVGRLTCVSCNPTGSRPIGSEVAVTSDGVALWGSAELPGWAEQTRPTRFLSEDGDRLFFQSFDALVPRDTNGVRDIYEWEGAGGAGQCAEQGDEIYVQAAGGCISLISSGTSNRDSELIDASEGGTDVFFATEASLVPQDPGSFDVYDARVNGGFPAVVKSVSCEGEERCQPAVQTPPQAHPASGAAGPGNPSRPPCPKGKHAVKKKGKKKCVANKKKKQQKGGHTKKHRDAHKSRRVGR